MEKEALCPGSLTMTVTLELEPEVESLLEKRARAEGCDVKGYVEKLVERDVNRERTFDEILAPFRDAVERSGISDEELDTLFAEARRSLGELRESRTGAASIGTSGFALQTELSIRSRPRWSSANGPVTRASTRSPKP